jgi:predicted DNA-binding helix-hairpin-helix protein
MRQITNTLIETNSLKGPGTMFGDENLNDASHYLGGSGSSGMLPAVKSAGSAKGTFAAAGQTTQMIIGAGGESDASILATSENLYRTFKMKRVYYSAYIPVVDSPILPDRSTAPPLKREHRIYQADWLLRFYGFTVSELFRSGGENLDPDLDPKVTWALRNLDRFPIEVNKASYEELMRIPGIGHTSAKRIMRQRRFAAVRFDDLKKMGVVIKRAKYFVLCCGRYYGDRSFEPSTIKNSLLQMESGLQMSMFNNDWKRIEEGERREKLSAAGVI